MVRACRWIATAARGGRASAITKIIVSGAGPLEGPIFDSLDSRVGQPFDPKRMEGDRARLQADPRVATVAVETSRGDQGVELTFRVVLATSILGETARAGGARMVGEVVIRGNRRIETEAIRTRIRTQPGKPLDRAQLSRDVREVFAQGFFRNRRPDTYREGRSQESGVRRQKQEKRADPSSLRSSG